MVIKEIFPRKIKSSKLGYVKRKTINFPEFYKKTLVISKKTFILDKNEGLSIDEDTVVGFFKFMFKMIWEKY